MGIVEELGVVSFFWWEHNNSFLLFVLTLYYIAAPHTFVCIIIYKTIALKRFRAPTVGSAPLMTSFWRRMNLLNSIKLSKSGDSFFFFSNGL